MGELSLLGVSLNSKPKAVAEAQEAESSGVLTLSNQGFWKGSAWNSMLVLGVDFDDLQIFLDG